MSERIDPEDQDSNEPIKHSHYSNGVPTGREFEHLYGRVEQIDRKVDGLCADMNIVKSFIIEAKQTIEEAKEAKRQAYVRAGIFATIISVIIGAVSRLWGN